MLIEAIKARMVAAEQATPLDQLPVKSRDPKDDMLLACALGGPADYLVTGDQDLLELDGDEAVSSLPVVTAGVFLS